MVFREEGRMPRRQGSTGASTGRAIAATVVATALGGAVTVGLPQTTAAAAHRTAAARQPLQTVSLEIPSNGVDFLPYLLGKKEGIYKKYGIDLQIQNLGPPLAVQAIQSGALDYMSAIGSAANSAIKGAPMRVVACFQTRLDFVIVGAPGIHSVADLAGKTIAGESAVAIANQAEDAVLTNHGVPATSVSVVNVPQGGDPARLAPCSVSGRPGG